MTRNDKINRMFLAKIYDVTSYVPEAHVSVQEISEKTTL